LTKKIKIYIYCQCKNIVHLRPLMYGHIELCVFNLLNGVITQY